LDAHGLGAEDEGGQAHPRRRVEPRQRLGREEHHREDRGADLRPHRRAAVAGSRPARAAKFSPTTRSMVMLNSPRMQPLTAYAPYRSAHGRAVAVTVLLALSAAVSLLSALSSVARISSGTAADLSSDEPTVFDFLEFAVGLIHIVVLVTTVVLVCVW